MLNSHHDSEIRRHSSITNQLNNNPPDNIASNFKMSWNCIRKDEYVDAMVEDLCDWLNFLYKLNDSNKMTPSCFFSQLQNGVILNKHANSVQYLAEIYLNSRNDSSRELPLKIGNRIIKVPLNSPKFVVKDFNLPLNSFHQRDNVANFIKWCRDFNIPTSLTFESEDLIMMKHPRNVVVCLLEVARIGKLFGMEVPDIIQLEEEIECEIMNLVQNKVDGVDGVTNLNENSVLATFDFTKVTMRKKPKKDDVDDENELQNKDFNDNILKNKNSNEKENQTISKIENSDTDLLSSYGASFAIPKYKTLKPVGRVKIYDCFDQSHLVKDKKYREKCDLRSLDERVREILSECQCIETFPMKRISEGKYQWGDKKTHIFVRILRNHVMVRVGGGWDTLNEFLRKHDRCRKYSINCSRPPFNASTNKSVKGNLNSEVDFKQPNTNYEIVQNGLQCENTSLNTNCSNHIRRHSIVPIKGESFNTQNNNKQSTSRPLTLVVSASNNCFPSIFKTPEFDDIKFIEPNYKPVSSEFKNNLSISLANEINNLDSNNIDDQSEIYNLNNSQNIESNQKYLSKIPVLKKR